MLLNIGENIRRLRSLHALTQEKLAELLNVSAQAVSRWESGAVYPDLDTLPGIANYFGVSLDELTGMDSLRGGDCLNGIFARESELRSEGKLTEAEMELRRGLKLYPNNLGLMSELALTLTRSDGESEAIALSERVLAGNPANKLRATTAANLVFLYLRAGERDKAAKLVSTFAHVWESRELVRAELSDGEYREVLKRSVREVLSVICMKIDGEESHVYGKPARFYADGPDFSILPEDGEMLNKVTDFLTE